MAEKTSAKTTKKKAQSGAQSTKGYVGTMGEHFVMAELMARGFNVARAVVDEGVDVIAFKPENPQKLYRIQVKTSATTSGGSKTSRKYLFSLKQAAYKKASGQDYYLILVIRDSKDNSFVSAVIPKAIFDDYIADKDVIDWSESKQSFQIGVHLHNDGKLTLKNKKGKDITDKTKNRWDRIN